MTASPSVSKRVLFRVQVIAARRSDYRRYALGRGGGASRGFDFAAAMRVDGEASRGAVDPSRGSHGCVETKRANRNRFRFRRISSERGGRRVRRAAHLVARVWRRGGDPATTWASSVATLFPMTRKRAPCFFPGPALRGGPPERALRARRGVGAGNLWRRERRFRDGGSRARSGARRRGSPRRRRRCSGGCRRGRRSHRRSSRRWTTRRWTTRRSSAERSTRVRPWTRKTRKSLPSRTAAPRATTKTTRAPRARRRDDVALSSLVRRFVPSTRTRARRSSPRSTRGSSRCSWTRAWWTRARRTRRRTARKRFRRPESELGGDAGTPSSDHRGGGERGWRARGFLLRRRARREARVRGPRRADVLARVRDAVHRARVADLLGLLPSAAMANAAKDEREINGSRVRPRETLTPLLRRLRRHRTRAG